MARSSKIERETRETKISVALNLDAAPESADISVKTGIGFLDHMLECFARHARVALQVNCIGDLHIDQHHTVEDVGIVLGQAVASALGDCSGIERFGMMECPLDEALSKVVVDVSGRPYLHFGVKFQRPFIGQLDSSLLREFFGGFALHAKWTIHIDSIRGENEHHIAESVFKAFARSARAAWTPSGESTVLSTKGMIV